VSGQRWTVTRVAGHVHRSLLQSEGFDRRGTHCWREDFLLRSIDFAATQWTDPTERYVAVSVGLRWRGLPPPQTRGVYRHDEVGTDLKGCLAPLATDTEVPAKLLRQVAGPGLRYAALGSSPQDFIDLLCDPTNFRGTDWLPVFGDGAYLWCAAYGAALIGDKTRLRRALDLIAAVDAPHPDHEELLHRELQLVWTSCQGGPLPIS
jgi:hypothetical protein